MLLRDVLAQLHDAVRFSAKATDRSGIVERIAGDGQLVDSPEAHFLIGVGIAFDDRHPSQRIDAIDDNPDANDGDEPITCAANVTPKLYETDVERKEHHDDTDNAEDKEEVIPIYHLFIYHLPFNSSTQKRSQTEPLHSSLFTLNFSFFTFHFSLFTLSPALSCSRLRDDG